MPPLTRLSPFKQHIKRWENCQACTLCEKRKKIVLFKGKVPCDCLFIGEAPGASEDVFGAPFMGPAGHQLDAMIDASQLGGNSGWRLGFTNLIACIPKGDDDKKIGEPEEKSIKACADRLKEIVRICKPRQIVLVGKLAAKHVKSQAQFDCDWLKKDELLGFTEIIHPAAILRADVSVQGLAIQRTVVALTDVADNLSPF